MSKLILKNDDGKIIAEYDTDNVLWQILEKDPYCRRHDQRRVVGLSLSNNKCSTFADEASRLGRKSFQNMNQQIIRIKKCN